VDRPPGSRFRSERVRGAVISALLLANVVGGTALLLARANPSTDDRRAMPVTTSTTGTTGATATTVAAEPTDCGRGTAAARAVLSGTGELFRLSARVDNEADRAIEIDSLVVRAVYPDGTREFEAPTVGMQVEAETGRATFPAPGSDSPVPPSRFEIAEFKFHTAGQPECASH
jgi:hypothetical protein